VGELDGRVPQPLAHEAAAALEEAADRALRLESFQPARRLFVRADQLEASLRRRYMAALSAFRLSDFECARDELTAVRTEAAEAGAGAFEGKALLLLASMALHHDANEDEARALADEAIRVLAPDEDRAQFDAHVFLANIGWWTGDLASVEEHGLAARRLAEKLGRPELVSRAVSFLARTRAEQDPQQALELYEEAIALADESGSLEARAEALAKRSQIEQEQGRFEQAAESVEDARRLFEEIGGTVQVGWSLASLGEIRLEAGDVDGAEQALKESLRLLSPLRQRGSLVEAQRLLADVMLARGRVDEAERYALAASETVGREDAWSRALALSTLGLVRAAQGRFEDAERLIAKSESIGAATGFDSLRRRLRKRRTAFELTRAAAPARP
jgi:tetratricopeptide (TPR) repeat protein